MSTNNEKIGSRIRYYRTQKNLSQEQLASLLDVHQVSISYFENGTKGLSLESLIDISNALNVSTDDLLQDVIDFPHNDMSIEADKILLDCSPEENSILISNMSSLKKKLREYTIKK